MFQQFQFLVYTHKIESKVLKKYLYSHVIRHIIDNNIIFF